MGTKNEGDSCYEKALPDEPMFVLLARDEQAPRLVRNWADDRRAAIAQGDKPKSDMAQVDEAFALALRMEEWRWAAKEAWRDEPSLFDIGASAHDDFEFRTHEASSAIDDDVLNGQHIARREGDEYVCGRCHKRWDAAEEAPDTCA